MRDRVGIATVDLLGIFLTSGHYLLSNASVEAPARATRSSGWAISSVVSFTSRRCAGREESAPTVQPCRGQTMTATVSEGVAARTLAGERHANSPEQPADWSPGTRSRVFRYRCKQIRSRPLRATRCVSC